MGIPPFELIGGALLLALRVYGLGAAWQGSPCIPARWFDWAGFARSILLGCLLNLALALILVPFGWWTVAADWAAWLGLLLVGGGRLYARPVLRPRLSAGLIGIGALTVLTLFALLLPLRSEWLAGGWDPGIYQNNAIAIAQRNGIQARTDSLFTRMSVEERRLFTHAEADYHELFPSVPVRLDDGAMPLYHFHVTAVWGAWLYRLGGEAMLFRQATLTAWWCLPVWLALAGMLGFEGRFRYGLLIPVALASWWWYHQALPTAEMLYLFLISGIALVWRDFRSWPGSLPWVAILGLVLAVINHLNAALLLAVGLVFAAWWDEQGAPGRRRWRYAVCFAALALGIGWNGLWAPITIDRLQAKDNALALIVLGWALCALVGITVSGWNRSVRWLKWDMRGIRLSLAVLGGLLLAGAVSASSGRIATATLGLTRYLPTIDVPWRVLLMLIPFQGMVNTAWAGIGLIVLSFLPLCSTHLERVLLGLGMLVVLLLIQPGIAPIYPWALRRFFVFWMPWLMLAQAGLLLWLAVRWRRWPWLAALLAVVTVWGLYDGLKMSRRAARVGDYRGLVSVLHELAGELQANDLIIADDPRWGTPLTVAYGFDVLNGQHLWQSEFVADNAQRVALIQRWQAAREGRMIWLTSTDQGLDFYPLHWGGDEQLLLERRFSYPTVIHSRRARTFAEQTNERTLRLFVAVPVGHRAAP